MPRRSPAICLGSTRSNPDSAATRCGPRERLRRGSRRVSRARRRCDVSTTTASTLWRPRQSCGMLPSWSPASPRSSCPLSCAGRTQVSQLFAGQRDDVLGPDGIALRLTAQLRRPDRPAVELTQAEADRRRAIQQVKRHPLLSSPIASVSTLPLCTRSRAKLNASNRAVPRRDRRA